MKARWFDAGLMVLAALGTVGVVRSVLVLSPPAAADLPEPLRREGPRLAGYRSIPEPTKPARKGRDLAWGPTHRYKLVPHGVTTQQNKGTSLLLELVVRRHRIWYAMALPDLTAATKLRLTPRVQVMLGTIGTRRALQTCLVGSGRDEKELTAAVDQEHLQTSIIRWNESHDPMSGNHAQLKKAMDVQLGLRMNRRWECLLVTLQIDNGSDLNPQRSRQLLVSAWNQLSPELEDWGKKWDGLDY